MFEYEYDEINKSYIVKQENIIVARVYEDMKIMTVKRLSINDLNLISIKTHFAEQGRTQLINVQ